MFLKVFFALKTFKNLAFTALHGMQSRYSDENSVRLSVKRVNCDKTAERYVCPRWSEIADFEPIIARSASAVRPSEKSSINTNRKYPTRFPMSLRWSSYVASKSPKGGGLKNAKRQFSLYNRNSLEESLLQSFFVWKLSEAKL